jgi:hypothetical protein
MKSKETPLVQKLQRITYLWVILLLLTLFMSFLSFSIKTLIHAERTTRKDELMMIKMGVQLAKGSDFLTAQARRFAVTANPKALQAYWHEVNVLKNRDQAVQHLKRLSAKKEEIRLLEQSKENSDQLINTEARSMRLVMDAYHIAPNRMPLPIRSYLLSEKDNQLSGTDKILLAQLILFDDQYQHDKALIMDPIELFKATLEKRVRKELKYDIKLVNNELYWVIITSITISLCILMIIYIRVGLLQSQKKKGLKREARKTQ